MSLADGEKRYASRRGVPGAVARSTGGYHGEASGSAPDPVCAIDKVGP